MRRLSGVFSSLNKTVISAEQLAKTRSEIYRVTCEDGVYIYKTTRSSSLLMSNAELYMYRHLHCPYIRTLVYSGQDEEGNVDLVLPYVEGKDLRTVILAPRQEDLEHLGNLPAHMCEYIYAVNHLKLEHKKVSFGYFPARQSQYFTTWHDFLVHLVQRCKNERSEKLQIDAYTRAIDTLMHYLDHNAAYFTTVTPSLTPIDMNLTNFLLTDEGTFFAMDLKSMVYGDVMMTFGEWQANVETLTSLSTLTGAWQDRFGVLSADQRNAIEFYSLLSNVGVLSFIAKNQPDLLQTATPWANPSTTLLQWLEIRTDRLSNLNSCEKLKKWSGLFEHGESQRSNAINNKKYQCPIL